MSLSWLLPWMVVLNLDCTLNSRGEIQNYQCSAPPPSIFIACSGFGLSIGIVQKLFTWSQGWKAPTLDQVTISQNCIVRVIPSYFRRLSLPHVKSSLPGARIIFLNSHGSAMVSGHKVRCNSWLWPTGSQDPRTHLPLCPLSPASSGTGTLQHHLPAFSWTRQSRYSSQAGRLRVPVAARLSPHVFQVSMLRPPSFGEAFSEHPLGGSDGRGQGKNVTWMDLSG